MPSETLRSVAHACPADEQLIGRYTEGHDSGQLKPSDIENDLKILGFKQAELRLRSIGCQGINADGTCPARQRMDVDPIRKGTVKAARSLRGLLRR